MELSMVLMLSIPQLSMTPNKPIQTARLSAVKTKNGSLLAALQEVVLCYWSLPSWLFTSHA